MVPKPMVLVTIYPDGWVETRSTDDVDVKIHEVQILKGRGTDCEAEHGITKAALALAYRSLPIRWRVLVDQIESRAIQTGLPDRLPEQERYDKAVCHAVVESIAKQWQKTYKEGGADDTQDAKQATG